MHGDEISTFINLISDTYGSGDFGTAMRNLMLIALVFLIFQLSFPLLGVMEL